MSNNTTSPSNTQVTSNKKGYTNFQLIVHTSDEILNTTFSEPVCVVPGLLPVGLTILGGAPKVGKSFLALQAARAVASGGAMFGESVEQGKVLYIAAEDLPRRLQERMRKQGWTIGANADFVPIGEYKSQIGDLRNGGGRKLAQTIQERNYRLVIIDTLSRAVTGNQNDVEIMTSGLAPLQEMAHKCNSSILVIDHHHKGQSAQDLIADILGSTAKGAMADTIIGLYRDKSSRTATLLTIGREVEEKTIKLQLDRVSCTWRLASDGSLTAEQDELLTAMKKLEKAGVTELATYLNRNKGTVQKQLVTLGEIGKVRQLEDKNWILTPAELCTTQETLATPETQATDATPPDPLPALPPLPVAQSVVWAPSQN